MTNLLSNLEAIGSLLVFGQSYTTGLALKQILKDKSVAGMSIWTMAFYGFASWFYVPVFYLSGLFWTMIAVAILGGLELGWCALALKYKR